MITALGASTLAYLAVVEDDRTRKNAVSMWLHVEQPKTGCDALLVIFVEVFGRDYMQ